MNELTGRGALRRLRRDRLVPALVATTALMVAASASTAVASVPRARPAQTSPPPVEAGFPPYPNFTDGGAAARAQAQSISDGLERYIEQWMAGKAPATIPASVIPSGVAHGFGTFTLQRPEQVDPSAQWVVHEAQPSIDLSNDYANFNDPHATYLIMPAVFAPFGTKVILSGQFPHARFFDVQVSPTFDPYGYYYNSGLGLGEVPIVDADIKPDRGSVNPFRVGANRNAAARRYTVDLTMAMGNAAQQNPSYKLPYWRGPGNTRRGGSLEWIGPWGCPPGVVAPAGGGFGCITSGDIWLRYYAPDHATGPRGGVPLPKVLYQLPDGRRFYIQVDTTQWAKGLNARAPVPATGAPATAGDPKPGWDKLMGIYRAVAKAYGNLLNPADPAAGVRQFDLRVDSHGEGLPAPNSYEHGSTEASFIEYLTSVKALPRGQVLVITGRLPSIPKTRNGEPRMVAGQARYFSITGYAIVSGGGTPGQPINSLMDDEIVAGRSREYAIVYSRPEDRPANATAGNGATWVDWGPQGYVDFTIRWMDIGSEWTFCRAPNQAHLGWRADSVSKVYDPTLLNRNTNHGFLGDYQPVYHVMTRTQFEALGNRRIEPDRVPTWTSAGLGPPMPDGPTGCAARSSR